MLDLTLHTEDEELSIVDEAIAEYHLETYEDFADMLNRLAIITDYLLKYNEAPMDDVEKNNLEILRAALPMCADLMFKCDPYYRK